MPSIQIKRGTRAQLTSAAASSGLRQGEPYFVTDEARIDIGTSTSASESMAKKAEVDSKLNATNPVVTGTITEDVYAITDGASVDINPANGSIQTWTLGANRSPTASSFASGQAVTLEITAGAYAITWPSVTWVKVGGSGSAPTLGASGVSTVVLWKVGSTLKGCYPGST